MADPPNHVDKKIVGMNPCGEQPLESFELCNLVETFPSRHDTLDEYLLTLKYAYLYGKTVTLIPTHDQRTNAIQLRNHRIGLSQSGITSAFKKRGKREHFRWCDEGYKYVRQLDQIYSDWLVCPLSNKVTSVKPSGTVSLLPGVPCGIHYPCGEYWVKRMRIDPDSPLIPRLEAAGYHVELDVSNPRRTMIVTFPIRETDFEKTEKDVSVWEQVQNVIGMQRYWSDNAVSCTVKFDRETESSQVPLALELAEDSLKSISFMPHYDADTSFKQSPQEAITRERYEELMAGISPIGPITDVGGEVIERFCDGDTCQLPQ